MKHVQDRLPEYLVQELDRPERAEVEAHLEECKTCRDEYDTLLKLWSKLGSLPEEQPSELVRSRFFSMLAVYEEGLRQAPLPASMLLAKLNRMVEKFWPTQPAVQFGLAAVLLVLGIFGGTQVTIRPDHQTELYQLRGEVRQMNQLFTLSLLTQQSASERLKGVAWTFQMDRPDDQVLAALISALKYDPNVNVRLAAVDAIGGFLDNPDVRKEIMTTLPRESSPLVQIALIDVLVRERVRQSADILERMAGDPSVDQTVKKHIQAGLKELEL